MHNIELIMTLTGGLAAALFFGYLTNRIGLSPIVGYLLAGIAVGPHTPGFVANRDLAEQLAEIGVILLMFGVGLHFHIKELLAVRGVAIPGAIGQSLVATILGACAARFCGWSWSGGIVFGMAISVASTVVLIRVLTDARALQTRTGHIAVGWLVVEDLFTVIALVLLPALFGESKDAGPGLPLVLLLTAVKIVVLVAIIFIAGGRLIPKLLDHVAATRSRELFTLTVLVLALGLAVGSAKFFGVSMALGAFLAGMAVGRSDFSLRAASEALPLRDAFAVLFFVSVGMLFSPSHLIESPGLVAATLLIVLIGKPLSAFVIVIVLRYPAKVAISVAVALAQIGEFSFILGAAAASLGVLPPEALNVLVAVAIVSITLNPILYRMTPKMESWLPARLRSITTQSPEAPSEEHLSHADHTAIVVGYGPVGRTIVRILNENQITPVVIELNMDTVRQLREEKIMAVYGDAAQRDVLEAAGISRARSIVFSADVSDAREIIRLVRELNPSIKILARATYLRDLSALRSMGADSVFAGEAELAIALTVSILRDLGATPEQIDRERERVNSEILQDS